MVDEPWRQPDPSACSDSSARAVLQLMVESVAELVGFEVAALSVVLGEELVTLAYTGPEEHRAYMEEPDPVSIIEPVLARAVGLGPRLRFIEATPVDELEGHWVQFEPAPCDHPDAWRADEEVFAVLSDDDGAVVGILSVDLPVSGRKPDARQLSLLERYAAQAERAVLTLFERQALLEQVAHAESARRLIREASRPTLGSLEDVLRHTHGQLVASFDARASWLHVFQPDGPGTSDGRTRTGERLAGGPRRRGRGHRHGPGALARAAAPGGVERATRRTACRRRSATTSPGAGSPRRWGSRSGSGTSASGSWRSPATATSRTGHRSRSSPRSRSATTSAPR